MTAELAEVPLPEDSIPLIDSDPDEGEQASPFQIAYRRAGDRVVETFQARVDPPFAIFRRLEDLQRASKSGVLADINPAMRRLLILALTEESSTRLLRLIEGDEDEVGVITSGAIGGVVDFIKRLHYKTSPTRPGSSNGGKRAGAGSRAASSGSTSTSKRSPRKKA